MEVFVQAFLWERDVQAPYARIYDCPHCKHAGEFPATPADIENAARYSSGGLHQARALGRIAPVGDPDRAHAEEALEAYLPRAVYALFTLINKLDGLALSPQEQMLLKALLISACDRANILWPHPSGRARPRQLSVPTRYRENNVWFALENASREWVRTDPAVPLVYWPEKPPKEGGICLFEGRLRDLGAQLSEIEIKAVTTAFPRPNQAFWTLSALWAGWLWGREALGTFASVLRRRRYDWAWHTTALSAALSRLAPHLARSTSLFGLVTESEPSFDAAVMIAADIAGFELDNLALRTEDGQTQMIWHYAGDKSPAPPVEVEQVAKGAALKLLAERGEPSKFLRLQAAAIKALSENGLLSNPEEDAAVNFSRTRSMLEHGFSFQSGFLRYGASESSPEIGRWWLRETGEVDHPLADRLEVALVRYLLDHPACRLAELDTAMCAEFPGLLTPESSMVLTTLESYGEEVERDSWQMRAVDSPQARRADLENIRALITDVGERLGYEVEDEAPLLWLEPDGELGYTFYVIASAVIGEIMFGKAHPPERSFVVLPGGRSNLVMYKVQRDPRLEQAVEEGWRFLKFRHVRRLAENLSLTRTTLDELFALDPLTYDQVQMTLL
jgi:hypothetical protein